MKTIAVCLLVIGIVGMTLVVAMAVLAMSTSMAIAEGVGRLSMPFIGLAWCAVMLPYVVFGIPFVRRQPLADRRSFQLASIITAVLPWLVIIPPMALGRGLVSVPTPVLIGLPVLQLAIAAIGKRAMRAC